MDHWSFKILFWYDNTSIRLIISGGSLGHIEHCGCFCLPLHGSRFISDWDIGAYEDFGIIIVSCVIQLLVEFATHLLVANSKME